MPLMAKNIPTPMFNDDKLNHIMRAIFTLLSKKENKDRGSGFISLGKMSLLVNK